MRLITVLLAAVLAACGGAIESAPSTSTGAPKVGDSTGPVESDAGGESGKKSADEAAGEEARSTEGGDAPEEDGDSGAADEESRGSREFVVPGADNSVPNFGEEATAAEREQASGELETYLRARASGDSKAACAVLSEQAIEQIESLASTLRRAAGSTCAALFDAIDERTPASERANTMAGPITSLRVEGDQGFALYHGTEGIDHTIQMNRDGGIWKVGALLPYAISAPIG